MVKETVLNDLYSQYRSLEAIGVADDKLYVRAIYWGEEKDLQNPQYAGKSKSAAGWLLLHRRTEQTAQSA